MRFKRTWIVWLDQLKRNNKDTTDPTHLMQAFSLTRQESLDVIAEWQKLRSKSVDVFTPALWLGRFGKGKS